MSDETFGHSVIRGTRQGSALLIVLGMTAFMVISAVAFSAYMRFSRLPSSYLRRASSSRLLVKAALAEAIDEIDIAIGNDPFPYSMGHEFSEGSIYSDEGYASPRASVNNRPARIERRNYWRNNCFIGTNRLMLASDTVSTLTLEGLAYLPPALINEARYYSRHSAGATWHNFGFDVGRYAFFAVDVSDHFDVNRVFADAARTSSDRGRITLAHVFDNPTYASPASPKDWDDFVGQVAFGSRSALDNVKKGLPDAYGDASSVPFTSVADLNLAMNGRWSGSNLSPFCNYVVNGPDDFFVDRDAILMPLAMPFVADSYTPSTNSSNSAKYDLCYSQPFARMYHEKDRQMSYEEQMDGGMSTDILTLLNSKVTELDTISLYDYLDENDIPTSLALPSVERVPMICALKPYGLLDAAVDGPTKVPEPPTEGVTAASPPLTVKHIYKLKVNDFDLKVEARTMYPFLRNDEAENSTSFDVDFAVRIGFAIGNGPGMRTVGNSVFTALGEIDFTCNNKENVNNDNFYRGGIRLYRKGQQPKCKNATAESVLSTVSADFMTCKDGIQSWFESNDNALYTVPHKYEAVNIGTEENPKYEYQDKGPDAGSPPTVNNAFHPVNADGTGDGGFNPGTLASGATVSVTPYVTVFARVKSNQSNKTVDLVPAHADDDEALNMVVQGQFVDSIKSVSGTLRPLITLNGDKALVFGEASGSGGGGAPGGVINFGIGSNSGTLVCPDPRWNFAPENFFIRSTFPSDGADQLATLFDLGANGRDNDIFMAVSNQGYMQSPSEFAFLPRTTTLRLPCADQLGSAAPNFNNFTAFQEFETLDEANYEKLAHGRLMWKTYRTHAGNDADDDRLYSLGITSAGSGFRVNPYTTSKGVMAAALANTPYSWWAASTNYTSNARGKSGLAKYQYGDAETFNKMYAFSAKSDAPSKSQIDWNDLDGVAANFAANFRSPDYDSWEDAYQALWNTHILKNEYRDYLCGVKLDGDTDDLYEVDRKMLYGFWRDSFAVRQQLFLVFVRAEPSMMGGAGVGQTPPQLGARAVALVWRDPNPTAEDVGNGQPRPHRTRILFYRQFD